MTSKIQIQSGPRNPFRPGMGLDPPYLADRQNQLERFGRFIGGFPDLPRNVRLTGLRGVGKTVLLQHYAALAEEAGWIVVRRSWSGHLTEERIFALAFVEDCRQAAERSSRAAALRGAARNLAAQALDLLGSLTVSLEGVTVGIRPAPRSVHRTATYEDQLYIALRSTAESVLAAGHRGILFCYDEAHVVRDSARERQYALGTLLAAIARAQMESTAAMLVLSGLPTLTENLARAKSYSERMFWAESLDRLRAPEDALALARPLDRCARTYGVTVPRRVADDTSGYPYFIQLFGALLWEAVEQPNAITEGDYKRIRPLFQAALDQSFFDARLARTSGFERRMLRAIAEDGESSSMAQVVRRMRISNGAAQGVVIRLMERGLVYRPERGLVAFAVPLFGEYLQRSHAQTHTTSGSR